ncbi:(E2-independent) E3 ubiquitin-conjugating enzyme FATS isoform X2 [Salminus brasiliensis]|uniref:(E2-independent) E3 ubiquitin-conjugating enzyme FATS isoform X2 n=1 Tax=Salminus brasiliensis TaxID=930266 RepID=UPI003B831768
MDGKSESWRRLPKSRQDSTAHLHRRPEWRRSGDASYWEGLVAQVDRPPRAARPQSCLEGNLMDDWLQTLKRLQAHPVQQQVPAFADRTASMPVLPNKTVTGSQHYPSYPSLQNREWTPSVSLSLGESSLDSLDSLDSHPGLEVRERARIKVAPSAQKAKLCRLTPVRIGWLPLQRHVVITNSPKTAHRLGNTSPVKLKPPITPVLSSGSVKACGSEDRPAEWSEFGMCSGVQRPWRIPGHGSAQAAGSGNHAPAKGNEDMAHDTASRGQMPELQPNGLVWATPVRRRGSIPQSSMTIDSSSTPRHSSSISSITITSRRVVRSSSLPDTNLPQQAGMRAPSPLTDGLTQPRQVTPRKGRKAVVVKVTEQRAETMSVLQASDKSSLTTGGSCSSPISDMAPRRNPAIAPSNHTCLELESQTSAPAPAIRRHSPVSSISLPTPETHQPVVLRRKATIVKVEHRESYRREAKGELEHRHSYTGGFRATSSVTYTSNPSHTNTEPLLPNEPSVAGSESQALGSVRPNKVNEKVKELHRSTLSFQLNSPPLHNPCSLEGPRRRRPASCYASMFSPSEPSPIASKDPGFQSTTSALPQKTNIDPASSTSSSSNRRWSTGAAESRDEIYPGRDGSAGDGEQKQRESALPGNQQPFTLIKVPGSSAHAAHDAILALNAAAVIANVRRQSQQRKSLQAHRSAKRKIEPSFQSQTAEASGGDEVCNGERPAAAAALPLDSGTPACVQPWHAEFVPLQTADQYSSNTHTLSALEQRRPDFIRRSQARVQAVEQKARERLQLHTHTPAQRRTDNTFKSHDRSISGKQQQFRRNLPEAKRRKEEERRKLASQTNRLRAELFKKKILEQVLHRGKD